MPTTGWWEALWPDPASVLAKFGVSSSMDVIDLCSGDGWFTLQIAKVARHIVAIDIDPNLLEVARKRLGESGVTNCDFVVGDAYHCVATEEFFNRIDPSQTSRSDDFNSLLPEIDATHLVHP
jgi:ubiquinone/menaquinone biosynthesis C-methylase UbiE